MVEAINKTRSGIDLILVKQTAKKFLNYYKAKGKKVSIAFVGDKTIKKLNKVYRKKDKITDVLSFAGDGDFLGEVIIDYAQIKRQAKKYRHSAKDELIFILVHGLLHLLGYNDKTKKGRREMEMMGEEFIKKYKP